MSEYLEGDNRFVKDILQSGPLNKDIESLVKSMIRGDALFLSPEQNTFLCNYLKSLVTTRSTSNC